VAAAKKKTTVKAKPAKKKAVEWTEARVRSFITSVLRAGSRKWPHIYMALNEAKTEKKVNVASGRIAQHFLCAMCKNDFSSTNVQVDHKLPVVCPTEGFVSWDVYIERLFCPKENLQVLCKPCHAIKSLSETKERTKK
jgi:5-methylcytosine-specific restriction endonuclease McrA